MAIAEIFLISEPNYSITIGSDNYFSLAVAAFLGGVFVFTLAALKVGNYIKFKQPNLEETISVKVKHN